MNLPRRHFTLGLLATAALQHRAWAEPGVQHEARALMGTQVGLTVVHADAAVRGRALHAAWTAMQVLADDMSRYQPRSSVTALALMAGKPQAVAVSPALMAVLQQAQAVAQATDGAFDPTVGAYADWRFGPDGAAHMPAPARLRAQQRLVDHRGLQLDAAAGTARLQRAGMRLDLGGIAKLPVLQAGLQALQSQGVHSAMIDGGGDVLCAGSPPGRDWRVGLRDPLAPQRLLGVLQLRDGVVASSGDYERFFDLNGRRYHHVLDPASGQPSQGLHGVALVARGVDDVNGLGAAMMVGGLAAAQRWLSARPGVDALLAGRQGHWLSAGLRARLQAAG